MTTQQIQNEIDEGLTPEEIEQERAIAKRITGAVSIDRLAMLDPEKVKTVIENRINALGQVRLAAIRATNPHDWTLNRDKEGHSIASLRKSGAVQVRKYFGISTLNVRPAETIVREQSDGIVTAEIFGDGFCALTGETVMNVRGARSSGEDFVGGGPGREKAWLSDLKEAARTNLENKVVRILSGMTAVSEDELKAAWTGTTKTADKCYRGHGFGRSSDRETTGTASDGDAITAERIGALVAAISKQKTIAEAELWKEATIYTDKDKKVRWQKSAADLKFGWQIERAWNRLVEKYGNPLAAAAPPAESGAPSAEEGAFLDLKADLDSLKTKSEIDGWWTAMQETIGKLPETKRAALVEAVKKQKEAAR